MGSIKNKAVDTGEHQLTEQEFAFIQMLNQMKIDLGENINYKMSGVLNNIAKTRLGYADEQDLQFELDFADEKRTLKVTKL